MGVAKYRTKNGIAWRIDSWIALPDGTHKRLRLRAIPTRELAEALLAKAKADAFEGRFFERHRKPTKTVADLWKLYEPVSRRKKSWRTERGRASHLLRHLGTTVAQRLTVASVETYRTRRLGERTRRGTPPAPATLDREVELLKRICNYAVVCRELPFNPIAGAKLLRAPNVRRSVVTEADFARLVEAATEHLRPILLLAFDTGMRKREILDLTWSRVDLARRTLRLDPQDTKSSTARLVMLTTRVARALEQLPRQRGCPWVFPNPETGEPWQELRRSFRSATREAGLEGLWFHDLRRGFVTRARRRGIPESVVMKMSGHRTRNVFDRYNIVTEEDLRDAVRRIEGEAKSAPSSVDS